MLNDDRSVIYLGYVQEILEHKSSKTTEIYTYVCLCGQVARRQVSRAILTKIKNPLDSIFKEEQT